MLLPRSQRSIFHLGEEGGAAADDDHGKNGTTATGMVHQRRLGGRNHGRPRGRDDDDGAVVGLQILVRHHQQQNHEHHHHHRPRTCHIVLKQMVWPPAPASHRCFLRACSLCGRELNPSKDVYMYRGDQGFCSQECRWQQIMADEAREREDMVRKERRDLRRHHHHHNNRGPQFTPVIRGTPRRLLAAA